MDTRENAIMSPLLLLVDALNILHRAFHAIAGLSTSDGRPTNALYGFLMTMRQLERVWRPTHWLVVFDGGAPPERLALCPDYKAGRPPMPDALRAQFPALERYLDSARIPRARLEGWEADDVMASAAVRAAAEGCDALLVSSDKDFMQIVNERVGIVMPGRPGERAGPDGVLARTGVRPDQVVDWLSLMGDGADNIPGVPGVGPKTAARLLARWETLAGIWGHLEELEPPSARRALADHRELVERNARVIRLRLDLAVYAALGDLERRPPDARRLADFYREMEFHSLLGKLGEQSLFPTE